MSSVNEQIPQDIQDLPPPQNWNPVKKPAWFGKVMVGKGLKQ